MGGEAAPAVCLEYPSKRGYAGAYNEREGYRGGYVGRRRAGEERERQSRRQKSFLSFLSLETCAK